jgi:hypothetical protein
MPKYFYIALGVLILLGFRGLWQITKEEGKTERSSKNTIKNGGAWLLHRFFTH